jgi:glycosyltransferase involved in cell wall biosynthesis
MSSLDLTILMPCLNEAETLAICIRQALAAIRDSNVTGEVLIADNGSTDGSQQIAAAEGARVIEVPTRGYGAALIAGIEAARGRYILMADADASYHFEHLPRFLPKLNEGYDLVMGNRFSGSIEPGAMPPLHRFLGNPVLSAAGRIFFRIPVRDFHCGLRAFRRDAILALDLRATGMEFASEMVVKSSLAGLRLTEVPTTLSPDGRSRPPHLRSWRDGWRHLRFLLLYSPRWLFFYPGLITLAVGLALSAALLPGPLVLHFGATTRTLDVDTLTYALGLVLIGTHITVFAVSAKVFATQEGFLPPNPQFERLFKFITLETGLLLGCVLLFIGAGTLAYALYLWRLTGYGNLPPTSTLRITLPSATALMLGVEVIFASFFLSLLGLNRR